MGMGLRLAAFGRLSSTKKSSDWIQYINTKKYGIGKIYEVDLECPDELHHLHNDYPCAAEKK